MSSLYNDFNPTPVDNINNFLTRFAKFSADFQGNPEQKARQLLASGQMSQEQFNQYAQIANQLYKFVK